MRFYKKWLTALGLSTAVAAQSYKVTNGTVTWDDNTFSTDSSSFRMDMLNNDGEDLEVKFKYLGPTSSASLFASGVYQEQFGLKLRSSNTCNLVYVMRRVSPVSKITISYKQNIGMDTHEECGDKGYVFIKDIPIPVIKPGTTQVLSARFDEDLLTVWVDDVKVWSGFVDYHISGIGGIRSDNAKIEFNVVQ